MSIDAKWIAMNRVSFEVGRAADRVPYLNVFLYLRSITVDLFNDFPT